MKVTTTKQLDDMCVVLKLYALMFTLTSLIIEDQELPDVTHK